MTFSTRTTICIGAIALMAFASACSADPSEQTITTSSATTTRTDTALPAPESGVNGQPDTHGATVPSVPAPASTTPPPKPFDYSEVVRYTESETRLGKYRDAFNSITGSILSEMHSGAIPSTLEETRTPGPKRDEDETPRNDDQEVSEDTILMTSLPDDVYTQSYPEAGINSEFISYPKVAITLPLVEGKPDFSAPLAITATLLDGSTFSLKKTGEQGIPFTGSTSGRGTFTVTTSVGESSEGGSPSQQTFVDGTLKTVPVVKIMGTRIYENKMTVTNIEQADKIILKKLQEVGKLQGSDWY